MANMNWISVEDRLPREGEWVLMFLATLGSKGSHKATGVEVYRAGMYFKDDHGYDWLSAANICGCPTVTHWMPLPEPPK